MGALGTKVAFKRRNHQGWRDGVLTPVLEHHAHRGMLQSPGRVRFLKGGL